MGRVILFVYLVLCIPSETFGEGIFGLKKGMTLEEIKKLDFGYIKQMEDDPTIFEIKRAKKPQGTDYVYLIVSPEKGLLKIRFFWTIEANPYGDELKMKFDDLKSILSEKYGEYGEVEKFDYLKFDSVWNAPKDYMRSLKDNERVLAWYCSFSDPNKWELAGISIKTGAEENPMLFLTRGLFEGFVMLTYEFQGWSDYVNRQNSQF